MPVQKFKTKIVEIEAIRFTGENVEELATWTGKRFRAVTKVGVGKKLLEAKNADDTSVAAVLDFHGEVFDELHQTWINVAVGQWIVKGAKGEFYPCDDETFHWKYEEVKDPDFTMTGTLEYRDGEVVAEGFEVIASPGHNAEDFEPVDPKDVIRKVAK